ncbi:PABPC [Mytilus edulis]|uniref:PABPC n=1 Tax=Mytilus edulis TaxID=6550 RepID=A0A8S3TKD9_MYTED|nr:PABPC [Mytilus edulis]
MNEDDIIEIMTDKTQKFKNVYIKNFGIKMSEKELKELFEPYGKITSLKIMTDVRGESRGFGFVCYQNSDDAEKAVEELNDIVINGKTLYVGRAQNKTERQAEIMDKNEEIRKIKICSMMVMTTEDGISKGFGFVCFSSPEEANKAVTEMNGIVLADKALYVCLAQRKDGQNCKMSQMLPTDEPRYSLFTMTQAHRNFYSPIPVQHSSPIPSWQALLRQPPPGFESIAGPQIGDRTYAAIRARQPDLAGAITGMLMKRDNSELSKMLESREVLEAKAREIVDELQTQKAKESSTLYTGGAIQVHEVVAGLHSKQANDNTTSSENKVNVNQSQETLTATMLATASQQEQEQMLGERLFPLILNMYPDLAGKITGMLLEMDNLELLKLLKSKESLEAKVQEAVAVLQAHQDNDSSTSSNIPVTTLAHPITGRSVTEQPACIPLTAPDTGPITTTPVRVPMQSGIYSERQIGNPTTIGRQANMIRPPGQSACMMSQMFPSVGPGYVFPNSQTQMPHPIPSWGQYPFMTHQTTPPLLQANVRGVSDFQVTIGGVEQRIPVLRFMIRDVLLVLLKHSTDESVICATEILKRTGALMEETAHLNGPAEGNFSEVFSQLGQLELQPRLNETTKYSITSLLKLKSRNWDRRDSLQVRATRSVTQNEQTDHELESSLGSITLENNGKYVIFTRFSLGISYNK